MAQQVLSRDMDKLAFSFEQLANIVAGRLKCPSTTLLFLEVPCTQGKLALTLLSCQNPGN